MLELSRKAGKSFDANLAVRVIAADRDWAHEANVFMREAEAKVTELLVHNQKSFDEFRKLQRKGVQWPHSPQLRTQIESAGFAYRPMMIKRDRCICDKCNVEISGWRPWHDPWKYHNYDRHDAAFKDKAKQAMQRSQSAAAGQSTNTTTTTTTTSSACGNNNSGSGGSNSSQTAAAVPTGGVINAVPRVGTGSSGGTSNQSRSSSGSSAPMTQ